MTGEGRARPLGSVGARPLGAGGARMLYNLADALYPELPRDLAPAAERLLLHRGLGAIRRVRLALLWL